MPNLAQWPLSVVLAYDTTPPRSQSFQVPFPRVEIVLKGVYRNTLCNESGEILTQTLHPGDTLILPADSWNLPLWDENSVVLSLLLGNMHLGMSHVTWRQASRSFESAQKYSCYLPGGAPIYSLFDSIQKLLKEGAPHLRQTARLLTSVLIDHALTLIEHPMSEDHSRPHQLYQYACSYIEENYAQPLSREQLSEHFQISPNYLSRIFKIHGKTGISEYITRVRIERAQFMLKRYPFQLDEIAKRCGFRDVNYFCRSFKKQTGRTPTAYRTHHFPPTP